MMVDPIVAVTPTGGGAATPRLRPLDTEATPTFDGLLRSGLADLEHSVSHAHLQVQRIALGEAVPTHRVMLALEDARLSLQLALAVRARLVEAYQDVMRMQL